MKKVTIGKVAEIVGGHPVTLVDGKAGLIEIYGIPTNRRLYDFSQLLKIKPRKNKDTDKPTIAYARVSSRDQKTNLETQVMPLESFCAANGWTYEVMTDLGSGMNYNKGGLQRPFVLQLAQNTWIHKGLNRIILGPTGVGKTFFSFALGRAAREQYLAVCYFCLPRFIQEVKTAQL